MTPPNPLRKLPSISELIDSPPLRQLVEKVNRSVVVTGARSFLDELRTEYRERSEGGEVPPVSEIAERLARRILDGDRPSIRPVINATGVLLHTGLGRAPLADAAVSALTSAARDYSSVELDLATGRRSKRGAEVESLLQQLTGAEAAIVVNNNAGATLLALAALARNREVVVSRGQLVEIGGSFRLPDIMSASGAVLREVGTTNKTRVNDYENAINESTGALMRIHTSNFRVVGFAESAALRDIVALGRRRRLPVIDDIGSGALYDFSRFGFSHEPHVRASISDGADLVLFSGDKLLGGPQCGVAVGKKVLVEQLASNPLARALRVGKMTLAALAATLRIYRDESDALQKIPLLQFLSTPIENLRNRAERLAPRIANEPAVALAAPVEDEAYLGGGSMPDEHTPTWCVAVTPRDRTPDQFAKMLRDGQPSVVARIKGDRVLFDMRSIFPRQDTQLVDAVAAIEPR